MTSDVRFLLADVGGTNSRFALADEQGRIFEPRNFLNKDFPDLYSVIKRYLEGLSERYELSIGAFAVAGPIRSDGSIHMTNLGWDIDPAVLARTLGLQRIDLLNDFTALAWSMPVLSDEDFVIIGPRRTVAPGPLAILGPGTGLGVSGLLPHGDGWCAISGEGGHVTLAPADRAEADVIERLRPQWGHVSAERLVSGPGLVAMYRLLAADDNGPPCDTPREVTLAATTGNAIAARVLEMFFSFLGNVTGNLALTLGAQGGVYLAGGILPQMVPLLQASCFRARFVDKGRYRDYLDAIPTYVVTSPTAAFQGLHNYSRTRQIIST
ncbi:MAG: glucokinase [Pseudomonadota bacterium]|nr:glucokinase [Pseudomonadota bacterium]